MLEADRQAYRSRRDARGRKRSIVHAEVRRRRRMDHERFRVADVGEVREERKGLDELAARIAPALELEGEDRTRAARIERARESVPGGRGDLGVVHARDSIVAAQVL